MKHDRTLTKAKLEELASTVGVGIIGFGLGALLANFIQQYAFGIILIGLIMHGWGMYRAHHRNKKERDHINSISQIKVSEISWINLLYWFCWIIIIGLAIYVLVKLL